MVNIVREKQGIFRFYLKSPSGVNLIESVDFENESKAVEAFNNVKSNPVFERKTNYQGKFVIHLKTKDGVEIGRSKNYTSEAGMENGIKNVTSLLLKSDIQTF